jgi:hypothetical protein
MTKTKGTPKVQGSAKGKRPVTKRPAEPGRRRPAGTPQWVTILLAVALAVVLLLAVSGAIGPSPDPVEERAEELRAQEAVRDREQIEELTAQAREVRDEVVPPLDEFNEILPPGEESPSVDADADQIDAWQQTMSSAASAFDDAPSGATGTNIARNSLGASLGLLESAVDLYAIAADVDGEVQQDLLERAGAQRDLAIRTWSIGATQLDAINIDAGFGHQHVYLEVEGTGAMTPDGAEDGEGATIETD